MMDETYFYGDAILEINPKAAFWLKENDLNQLDWLEDTTPIPDDKIKTLASKLKIAHDESENQKVSDLSSLKTKLKDLGLTDGEITLLNLKSIHKNS
tara:strand:- start:34 stop:324 length:291 start_codon:yes stop_codon:yes gene_type:complete